MLTSGNIEMKNMSKTNTEKSNKKDEDISFLEGGFNYLNELYPSNKSDSNHIKYNQKTEFVYNDDLDMTTSIKPPGSKELVVDKFKSIMYNAGYDDDNRGSLLNSTDGAKKYKKLILKRQLNF